MAAKTIEGIETRQATQGKKTFSALASLEAGSRRITRAYKKRSNSARESTTRGAALRIESDGETLAKPLSLTAKSRDRSRSESSSALFLPPLSGYARIGFR